MEQQELPSASPAGHEAAHVENITCNNSEPASLEGVLYWKKGKITGSSNTCSWWKRRYVVLNLMDESLSCYRYKSGHTNSQGQNEATKFHRRSSMFGDFDDLNIKEDSDILALQISARVPWFVKDVSNDSTLFVIEIETEENGHARTASTAASDIDSDDDSSGGETADFYLADNNEDTFLDGEVDSEEEGDNANADSFDLTTEILEGKLHRDIARAKQSGKPLRFYCKCLKGGNEKVLWLKAFARMNRLSSSFRKRKSLFRALKAPTIHLTHSRTRSPASAAFARESKQLDNIPEEVVAQSLNSAPTISFTSKTRRGSREREYKALPESVYPHRWMTKDELREELEKPSEVFHDLRQNDCKLDTPNNPSLEPEIGSLQLECMQGLGFPKLDRYSKTDAVIYVVCGPYAFCTDVIKNQNNPMWLAKSQRACNIPLHHAYARVYVGVFNDEKSTKDDFNGRVVLDIARLRPDCTYDVTLPLRLSAHVYSRRRRGAIRLRFRLHYHNLRSAIRSYLPKAISLPRNFKPNTDTIVPTGTSRAFRNVAITAHGSHLPGRFSFQQLRATLREINFTRKQCMTIIKDTVKGIREWENPFISAFIFFAWMHCVYSNAFSLVPAYVVSYFLLELLRNYAKYGLDGRSQRGFVPPSFEELLMGLLINTDGDKPSAIEPLNMRCEVATIGDSPVLDYTFDTHKPWGKPLFRAMGFMDDDKSVPGDDGNEIDIEDHLEFPFASGLLYPKFSVTESFASRKKRISTASGAVKSHKPKSHGGLVPKMIRKDSSGMKDSDDEDKRFGTVKFMRKSGASQLKGAASNLVDVGESLTEATGLQYVARPITGTIRQGLHYVAPPIKSGIKSGYKTGISGFNQVVSPLQYTAESIRTIPQAAWGSIRRGSSEIWRVMSDSPAFAEDTEAEAKEPMAHGDSLSGVYSDNPGETFVSSPVVHSGNTFDDRDSIAVDELDDGVSTLPDPQLETDREVAPIVTVPDQDIDYEDNTSNEKKKNRKRLTEDLGEVKERMHELTLHKFNSRAYVVKDSNSRYFQYQQKSAKRRKLGLSNNLDKLLNVGQYSHSNPVVARVGQYVEPIIGASHSFLCAFRALFNVMTWRDPFLTFWVSLIGFALVVILFIFPWRLALFGLGLWFVGPQNWGVRVLRKRGILPPKKERTKEAAPENMEVPSDQIVFKGHISQDDKRKPHSQADPKEIQYVVVPYSPLMSQRFYDWPPERDYAHVSSIPAPRSSTLAEAQLKTSFDSWTASGTPPHRFANSTHPNSLFSSTIASLEKKTQ